MTYYNDPLRRYFVNDSPGHHQDSAYWYYRQARIAYVYAQGHELLDFDEAPSPYVHAQKYSEVLEYQRDAAAHYRVARIKLGIAEDEEGC
jgi:hypothetical protein